MSLRLSRNTLIASSIVAAAALLAGGISLRPALAGGDGIRIGPFALVTCKNPTYCEAYENSGKGVGIVGSTSNAGATGVGVFGSATSGSGTGIKGAAGSGIGVEGLSSSNDGVEGKSTSGPGVYGSSVDNAGVVAYGLSGHDAMDVYNTGGGTAIYATTSGSGPGAIISSASSEGLGVYTGSGGAGLGLYVDDSNGPAAQILGTTFGVIAQATAGSGFPLSAEDQFGDNLMYVDGNGNVYAAGSYYTFLRTRGGDVAAGYVPSSASPTIEDDGTAQLIDGYATVTLDPAFAHAIDTSEQYHVTITPDADTRGLFVASKTPTSFVVREIQGGRDSLAFDYHIAAGALGRAAARLVEMTPAQLRAVEPRLPKIVRQR
jgi:hypothetical protein